MGQIIEETRWSPQLGSPIDVNYNKLSQGGTAEICHPPRMVSEELEMAVQALKDRVLFRYFWAATNTGSGCWKVLSEKDVSWGSEQIKSVGMLVEGIIHKGWPGPATLNSSLDLQRQHPRTACESTAQTLKRKHKQKSLLRDQEGSSHTAPSQGGSQDS